MHKTLWNKMIGEGEEVVYEFTIGSRWRNFQLGLIAVPLAAVAIAVGVFAGFATWWFGAAALIWFVVAGITFLYYRFYVPAAHSYALTNKRILVHHGWLNTHTTSIDYSKVTDVAVLQSFFDRILTNTGSIHINTAGSADHEVDLLHIQNPFEVKRKLGEVI